MISFFSLVLNVHLEICYVIIFYLAGNYFEFFFAESHIVGGNGRVVSF